MSFAAFQNDIYLKGLLGDCITDPGASPNDEDTLIGQRCHLGLLFDGEPLC